MSAQAVSTDQLCQTTIAAVCASCQGSGSRLGRPCEGCGGAGQVQVHQPAIKCPRCKGTGEQTSGYTEYPLCVVCRGCGWAMALRS
jgi:hypothetical protein